MEDLKSFVDLINNGNIDEIMKRNDLPYLMKQDITSQSENKIIFPIDSLKNDLLKGISVEMQSISVLQYITYIGKTEILDIFLNKRDLLIPSFVENCVNIKESFAPDEDDYREAKREALFSEGNAIVIPLIQISVLCGNIETTRFLIKEMFINDISIDDAVDSNGSTPFYNAVYQLVTYSKIEDAKNGVKVFYAMSKDLMQASNPFKRNNFGMCAMDLLLEGYPELFEEIMDTDTYMLEKEQFINKKYKSRTGKYVLFDEILLKSGSVEAANIFAKYKLKFAGAK